MELRRAVVILAICATVAHAAEAAVAAARPTSCPRPLSHRGDSRVYPANTLPAFEQALRQGFRGVELDVHFSRDDVAIVSHDDRLSVATNCKGRISQSDAVAVVPACVAYRSALIPESGLFAKRSKIPAPVPTLAAALNRLLHDPRVESVIIDIKAPRGPAGMISALQASMPSCRSQACEAFERKLTFISLNQRDAARLREAFPRAHVALESARTVSGLIDDLCPKHCPTHWADPNIDTYSVSFNSLFDPKLKLVKLLKLENLTPKRRFANFYVTNEQLPKPRRLLGWTINTRAGVAGLHRYQFDEVLTDLTYADFCSLWRQTAPAQAAGRCPALPG